MAAHRKRRKSRRKSHRRVTHRRTTHRRRKRRSAAQVRLRRAQKQCKSEHLPRVEFLACVRTELGGLRSKLAMAGRRRRRRRSR